MKRRASFLRSIQPLPECRTDSANWRQQSSTPPKIEVPLLYSPTANATVSHRVNQNQGSGSHSRALFVHRPPHASNSPALLIPPPAELSDTTSPSRLRHHMPHSDNWSKSLTAHSVFTLPICNSVFLQWDGYSGLSKVQISSLHPPLTRAHHLH